MTSLLSEHDVYRTGDLALAAALALFYPLEAVDRSDSQQPQWVFRRNVHLDALVAQYWGGELLVEPQACYQSVRTLARQLLPADS